MAEEAEVTSVNFAGGQARREDDLEIIARVSRSLLETIDLDEQLGLTIRLAADALAADRGSILLIDETGVMRVRSAEGLPPEAMEARIRKGEGIAGWVADNNEAVILHGNVSDPRFAGINPSIESSISMPLSASDEVFGVLNVVRHSGTRFDDDDLRLATSLADLAALAIEKARLYKTLQDRETRITKLLESVIGAQESERRRIAAEIHDGFLQNIAALFLKAEQIRNDLKEGRVEKAVGQLGQLQESIRHELSATREFIFEVRPPSLDEIGLAPTIAAMVARTASQSGFEGSFEDNLGPDRLSESAETVLYRVAQEGLRNVAKHAHATRVEVALVRDGETVRLSVTDDGTGIDNAKAAERGHFGVETMRERVEVAGGKFEIGPRDGGGTSLLATLPFQ